MASPVQDLLGANARYAANKHVPPGGFGHLKSGSPVTVIISCFDPRSCPESFFEYGHDEYRQITTVRVAGGRAQAALSSLLVAQHFFGIARIVVVHHTDCGRSHINPNEFRAQFPQEELKGIKVAQDKNPEVTVKEEVEWLRGLSYWSKDTLVVGMVYVIESGKVRVVD